ncbi:MAG: O-antigen ligase family protein [Sphingorhabdus sp.]|uniref:O-antigen ligase family protein n=1 Tax=Sphingorhabdus sp. TaxID=1902408 RepID=UPI0025DFF775|nr:O-antigen ligase family protein [Sphingorhabdus sp.]MCO4090755.1 O-antigen ligase family protein [Sphingorhabdus sp.]
MPKYTRSALPSFAFWGIFISLAAAFLMGGSSRADVQSLALLNPMMILCTGIALLTLRVEHWREHKRFLIWFGSIYICVAFYYLPSPLKLMQFLQTDAGVDEIRNSSNLTTFGQLESSAFPSAWQSLIFLFTPMAVLLFALQLKRAELGLVRHFLVFVGALSAIICVLQLSGGTDNPLYLYSVTNNGSAVGFFANRNHSAVFLACLFPILAVFASDRTSYGLGGTTWYRYFALILTLILVPLILVTGSRAGMFAAVVGLIGGALLYIPHISSRDRSKNAKFIVPAVMLATIVCVVMITIFFSRAEAIERFFAETGYAKDRSDFWALSGQLFRQYYPFGFGPGSFSAAFQRDEPLSILDGVYLNRLHNDWLETALTFGILGIVWLLGASIYFVYRSFQLWILMDGTRSEVKIGRMSSVIIAILAVASVFDYPLRTPAIMSLMVLALLWFVRSPYQSSHYQKGQGD